MRFIESNSDDFQPERKPPVELTPLVPPGGARSFAPSATLAGPQHIVLVRSGQTAREQAETAMRRLVEDGTRIMGAVLNDWTPDRAFNAYGSNYYGKKQSYARRG